MVVSQDTCDTSASHGQQRTGNAKKLSVDSRDSGMDDVRLSRIWETSRQERLTKEEEAFHAGRRIRSEVRRPCYNCNGPTMFLNGVYAEVECGHVRCFHCSLVATGSSKPAVAL